MGRKVLFLSAVVLNVFVCWSVNGQGTDGGYREVGVIQDEFINEVSGIALSRKNADIFWVHNDSGKSKRTEIYALNKSGKCVGIFWLKDVYSRDCEDIAIGPGPVEGKDYLYLGDIGDNGDSRKSVSVYRFEEPAVDGNVYYGRVEVKGVDKIKLKYPSGSFNAEVLLVDIKKGDIYIMTKDAKVTRVFKAAYPQSTTQINEMSLAAKINANKFTGGDISPNGEYVIVTSYSKHYLWFVLPGQEIWEVFSNQPKVIETASTKREAICFSNDNKGYYMVSEGFGKAIYYCEDVNLQH